MMGAPGDYGDSGYGPLSGIGAAGTGNIGGQNMTTQAGPGGLQYYDSLASAKLAQSGNIIPPYYDSSSGQYYPSTYATPPNTQFGASPTAGSTGGQSQGGWTEPAGFVPVGPAPVAGNNIDFFTGGGDSGYGGSPWVTSPEYNYDPNIIGHSYEGNQVRTYYKDGTSSLGPITGEKSGNWFETDLGNILGQATPYLAGGAMLAGGLTAAGIGPLAGAGATGAAGAGAGAVGAAGLTAAEIAAIQGVGSAAGAQATAGITGGTLAGAGILGAGAGMAMAPSGFGAAEIGTGAAGAAGAGVAGAGAAGVAGAAGAGALTGLPRSLTDTLIGLGIPLTVAGVASYLSGEQQSEAGSEAYDKQIAAASALYDKQLAASKEATLQAQEFWKQNAFMSPEAVDAYKKQGMAGLNALTETSQRNFLDASAARGFRGGGILTSGLADIERSRQKQYGGFLNELTQYANTPTFAPSGAPYSVPSSSIPSAIPSISGEQNLYNLLGGVGGMASGLGLYEYLYGKR